MKNKLPLFFMYYTEISAKWILASSTEKISKVLEEIRVHIYDLQPEYMKKHTEV